MMIISQYCFVAPKLVGMYILYTPTFRLSLRCDAIPGDQLSFFVAICWSYYFHKTTDDLGSTVKIEMGFAVRTRSRWSLIFYWSCFSRSRPCKVGGCVGVSLYKRNNRTEYLVTRVEPGNGDKKRKNGLLNVNCSLNKMCKNRTEIRKI